MPKSKKCVTVVVVAIVRFSYRHLFRSDDEMRILDF